MGKPTKTDGKSKGSPIVTEASGGSHRMSQHQFNACDCVERAKRRENTGASERRCWCCGVFPARSICRNCGSSNPPAREARYEGR